MKPTLDIPFFPYGTQYHRAPTPLASEWPEDLRELKKQGYTHVQFRPQWRCHERVRGQYVWDELDQLVELAATNELRVIIKTQLETAPDWVFDELGGGRIGFHGQRLDPIAHAAFYVGGWWPCFDNPLVRDAAFAFNRELACRYANHPALWFFNAWNEPRSRPLGQCQCAHSVASYQAWLQEKFGTVERLNAAYGKAWTSLASVRPPQSYSDYAELHLWRLWAEVAVAEQVRMSYQGLKAGAPQAVVMCHVGCSSVVQDPACDTSNDLLNNQEVDLYGCSFPVELHPRTWVDKAEPLFQSAWMRRVNPHYWIQEFYPNFGEWCEPPTPTGLAQILHLALAGGCHGFTYWQFRSERFGEESNGYGMREIDGSPTARSEACDALATVLQRDGAALQRTETTRGQVALLYHRPNDILMRMQTMRSGLTDVGSVQPSNQYSYRQAMRNAFALHRLNGHNAELVTPDDDFTAFALLHLTAVELMDEALAAKLKSYVATGGTLVIEYPFACREDNTWVTPQRPHCFLQELTGCTEGQRRLIPAGTTVAVQFSDGASASGGGWRVELVPQDGTDLLAMWPNHDQRTAVVRHGFGKGQVITCGANFALGWNGELDHGNRAVYQRFLSAAGLAVSTTPTLWELERRGPGGRFRFLFNVGTTAVTVALQPGERVATANAATPNATNFTLQPNGSLILATT